MSNTDHDPHDQLCDFCGRPIPDNAGHAGLVPDSSVIDEHNHALDGHRIVVACGDEHLDRLIELARFAFVDEQLWFGQLCRASRLPGLGDASLARLARRARLSPADARRALEWNARQDNPLTVLPGGQPAAADVPG